MGTLLGKQRVFRSRVGLKTSWASCQVEAPLGTRPELVQRCPDSGPLSRNRGLGLGPVPLATELVPESREGKSLRVGLGSWQWPSV